MQLTDTHCHLDFERFNQDREQVIQRAARTGVERILVPGIDIISSKAAIQLSTAYEVIYAAVGVHPNSGASWNHGTLSALRKLSSEKKVVAIGEIGLDYYRDHTPPHLQRKIFRDQLDLAAELGLPVVIHNRDASDDIVPLLVDWQKELAEAGDDLAAAPGVLHSFSESLEIAESVIEAGFFIGFTGPVTFNKAIELQAVASKVPLDRLLIETDAPYLTPHPFRGKRNEPAHVYYVAEKIAELRGITPAEVGKISTNNAKILFNW